MPRLRSILAFLLFSLSAFGQLAPQQTTGVAITNLGGALQNNMGQALAGVSIAIVTVSPGANPTFPLANLATVYTDPSTAFACTGTNQVMTVYPAGQSNCSNPGLSDGYGNWTTYVLPGTYWVVEYGAGIQTRVFAFSVGGSGGGGGGGSGTVTSVSVDVSGISGLLSATVGNPTVAADAIITSPNFAAHTFWGNNTGVSAQPGAFTLTIGDLPFTYSTTNGATKMMTASTLSGGAGTLLCEDANHNSTDVGCASGSGVGNIIQAPGGGVNQSVNQQTNTNFSVNRFENWKFAADLGLQAAINDCANNPGNACIVHLPAGTTAVCNITIPSYVSLRGMGRKQSILSCGTNNQPVLHVTGGTCNNVELRDFDVEHSVTPIAGGDGIVWDGGCDRGVISNVRAANNYNGFNLGWNTYGEVRQVVAEYNWQDGIHFTPDSNTAHKTNGWQVNGDSLLEQNGGDGLHMVLDNTFNGWQGTCPDVTGGVTAFGNNGYGFRIDAATSVNSGIADCFWDDVEASQNNNSGFYFNLGSSGGRNLRLTGFYSEQAGYSATTMPTYGYNQLCNGNTCPGAPSNTGYGIEIASTCDSTPGPVIGPGIAWQNSFAGVMSACKGTQFDNISTYTNGESGSGTSYQRAGIAIRGNNQTVTGGWMGRGSTQTYGVVISNSADYPKVIGTQFDTALTNSILLSTTPTHGLTRDRFEQTVRFAGCTTGTTQFSTCSATGTWPIPFPDTNYTATCTEQDAAGSLVGTIIYSHNRTASTIPVSAIKLDTSGTAFISGSINCIGIEDLPN